MVIAICEMVDKRKPSNDDHLKIRIETVELDLAALKISMNTEPKYGKRRSSLLDDTFLHKFSESVYGLIGLEEAVRSKNRPLRWMWSILFIFGVLVTIFFTYQTAQEYLDEPTATKVSLKKGSHTGVYNFPPILLCPGYWLDTEKALSMGLTVDGLKYALGYYLDDSPQMRMDNVTQARRDFADFYTTRNFTSLLAFYKAVSISLRTVHSQDDFDNETNAVRLDHRKSALTSEKFREGMCCAYNFGSADLTWAGAKTVGAKLVDKSRGLLGVSPSWWLQLGVDMQLVSNPVPPVHLTPFSSSLVLIHVRRFVAYNQGDSYCGTDRSTGVTNYSTNLCMAKCQNDVYREKLGCQLLRLTSAKIREGRSLTDFCHHSDTEAIRNRSTGSMSLNNFYESEFGDADREECMKRCPPECDRTLYQITLQWQQPMVAALGGLKPKNDTGEEVSYIELSVEHYSIYEGGIWTVSEVSTYSFTELINNVGGTLGLFVGATLMTTVQAIVFLVKYALRNMGSVHG